MNILISTREFNRKEKYNLYIKGGKSIKDLPEGTELDIAGYTIYEDENSKGGNVVITALLLSDGSVVSTSSETVRRELGNIVTGLGIDFDVETLKVVTARGVSKNERKYNTIEYAG
jgi:hypothetical protein